MLRTNNNLRFNIKLDLGLHFVSYGLSLLEDTQVHVTIV